MIQVDQNNGIEEETEEVVEPEQQQWRGFCDLFYVLATFWLVGFRCPPSTLISQCLILFYPLKCIWLHSRGVLDRFLVLLFLMRAMLLEVAGGISIKCKVRRTWSPHSLFWCGWFFWYFTQLSVSISSNFWSNYIVQEKSTDTLLYCINLFRVWVFFSIQTGFHVSSLFHWLWLSLKICS